MNSREKDNKLDMLHGPLTPRLMQFAIPLIASGLLQQSFNAVDVAVIGRYSTSQALAAVGSNGPLINILVNLFIGISIGANVVIANYIGRGNSNGIKKAVSTTATLSLVSGFCLLALGLLFSRPILEWMGAPHDVIDLATEYLSIYFLGMPFMMVYNFGSAILRSMGDTKRPFYALCVGSVVNVALNLLLVAVFDMGVAGVAIGTVVASAVNAAFIVWWLLREAEPFRFSPREMKVSGSELKKMLQIGVPAGMQGMVFSGANLFIQAAINAYGADAIAGSSAALTYEAYCYFIVVAFSQATVAFMSQNYGAGNFRRCKEVVGKCMILSCSFCLAANILITLFEVPCLKIFTSDPAVIEYGLIRFHTVLIFQFMACSYEITGSAMRGLGNSLTPMLLTVFGTCVLRLAWIYTVNAHYHDFKILLVIYPITWVVTGLMVVAAYFHMAHKRFLPGAPRTVRI